MSSAAARAHSRPDSDLDLAIELRVARSPERERQIVALGEALSLEDEDLGWCLRVQTVPIFADEKKQRILSQHRPRPGDGMDANLSAAQEHRALAEEALQAAELLHAHGLYRSSIDRSYYAAFHAASA